jgi:ABC-2 type transport system ATP-binding protein
MTSTSTRPSVSGASPVRTTGLRKVYHSRRGEICAVDGVDLEVRPGEFFGLLGPNGAGKSTTIGMLTATVVPTSGQAYVAGIDIAANPAAAKRRIGVAPQANTLDRQLSVRDNLYYHGRYFGVSRPQARQRASELLEQFALSDRANASVAELSGGMARRLLVARALMHRPDILFLDEPTAGIDPQTRINLWRILADLHTQGQTILLTTHNMEEADTLCEQIAILDHGKILAAGSPAELKRNLGADTVITVTVDGPATPIRDAAQAIEGVRKAEQRGATVRVFTPQPAGVLARLTGAASRAGLTVTDASSQPPSLETVYLALTGQDYRQ